MSGYKSAKMGSIGCLLVSSQVDTDHLLLLVASEEIRMDTWFV